MSCTEDSFFGLDANGNRIYTNCTYSTPGGSSGAGTSVGTVVGWARRGVERDWGKSGNANGTSNHGVCWSDEVGKWSAEDVGSLVPRKN